MEIITPKGDIVTIEENSTVLDFAFRIHSEVAYISTKGIVNGIEVSLDHILHNKDVVQVVTDEKSYPNEKWYEYITRPLSKKKLDSFDWEHIRFLHWKEKRIKELVDLRLIVQCEIDELRKVVKGTHTKVLLDRLNGLRKFCSQYREYPNLIQVDDPTQYKLEQFRQILKEELATREHVPNKIESRKIRQMKAKHHTKEIKP